MKKTAPKLDSAVGLVLMQKAVRKATLEAERARENCARLVNNASLAMDRAVEAQREAKQALAAMNARLAEYNAAIRNTKAGKQ